MPNAAMKRMDAWVVGVSVTVAQINKWIWLQRRAGYVVISSPAQSTITLNPRGRCTCTVALTFADRGLAALFRLSFPPLIHIPVDRDCTPIETFPV